MLDCSSLVYLNDFRLINWWFFLHEISTRLGKESTLEWKKNFRVSFTIIKVYMPKLVTLREIRVLL